MSEPGSPDSCPMSPTSPSSLMHTDGKHDQHKVREMCDSLICYLRRKKIASNAIILCLHLSLFPFYTSQRVNEQPPVPPPPFLFNIL
jgi:hypothetical protein